MTACHRQAGAGLRRAIVANLTYFQNRKLEGLSRRERFRKLTFRALAPRQSEWLRVWPSSERKVKSFEVRANG